MPRGVRLPSAPEHQAATLTARKILDCINKLQNSTITNSSVEEITTLIRALVNDCNTKFLKEFPIDVIYKPLDTVLSVIRSWYLPDLNLANLDWYIIGAFKDLETNSFPNQLETSNRCLDALRVLIDHSNVVVYSRFDHGLELEPRLDDQTASGLIPTHISIGDRL